MLSPSIEVILHVDTATDALLLTNRPVLVESPRAINGGLVDAGGHENIICAAVGSDGSLLLCCAGRVVRAVRLNNVVFHERVAGPAVNGQVAIALGVEGTAVVDDTAYMGQYNVRVESVQ